MEAGQEQNNRPSHEDGNAAHAFTNAHSLTQQKQAEQRLLLQYMVSCVLVEANSIDEAALRTLHAIGEHMRWEAGAFWMLDHAAEVLRCQMTWGTPQAAAHVFEKVSKQTSFSRGLGLPGRVWENGKATWISDIAEDSNFPRFKDIQGEGLHGAFAFPIYGNSGLLGVMEFFTCVIRPPDDELLRTVSTIGHQIGLFLEKMQAQQERLRLLEDLREAKRRMDEFLGIASHELRSPLTAVKGNIQLAKHYLQHILRGFSGQERAKLDSARDLLERAEHQVAILNRLIGDMVDISGIQAGKLHIKIGASPHNLATIITETVEEHRKAYPERIIQITHLPVREVDVLIDVDRIEQVLTNYLTNALKYSQADRPVEVRLCVEGDEARVAVRDWGPGLGPWEQEHIWERFYRARDVKVQTGFDTGLGLGLYICRMIIESHGGRVGVESAQGTGSTFWFTLPLAHTTPGPV